MGGVRIGNGAVIGARAVVAKNVPPYAVAVGNPACVIKYRFPQEIIDKLQKIKWWNWSDEKILSLLSELKDVRRFVDKFTEGVQEETRGRSISACRSMESSILSRNITETNHTMRNLSSSSRKF